MKTHVWLDVVSTSALIVAAFFFVKGLLGPPRSTVSLDEPVSAEVMPTEPISLDGAVMEGRPDAPVAMVIFSEFECPYCRQFAVSTLPEIRSRLIDTGLIRVAFRHGPFGPTHLKANSLAIAAVCADLQDRFWPMHDDLFAPSRPPDRLAIMRLANRNGLDLDIFETCLLDGDTSTIKRDQAMASTLRLRGTPTFFVGPISSDGLMSVTDVIIGAASYVRFDTAVNRARLGRGRAR